MKERKSKVMLAGLCVGVMAFQCAVPVTALAADQASDKTSVAAQITGNLFLEDPFGFLPQNTGSWKNKNGKWYYEIAKGIYLKDCWMIIDGEWYFFDQQGAMKTGWVSLGKGWQYLRPNGSMATGWQKVGSKWYFFDFDGRMKTGLVRDKGKYYFMGSDGAMQSGWKQVDSEWLYFNPSGEMAKGWKAIGKKWYYLDPYNGEMQTGWLTLDDDQYFLNSDGSMAANQWVKDPETNIQYYADASGKVSKKGYLNPGSSTKPSKEPAYPTADNLKDYNYEVYLLPDHAWSGVTVPFFIKTNCPNVSPWDPVTKEQRELSIDMIAFKEGERPTWGAAYASQTLKDIKTPDLGNRLTSFMEVEGGYLCLLRFDEPGEYIVQVMEDYKPWGFYDLPVLYETKVQVRDTQEGKNQWIDSLIARCTTSGMTPFEKMDAICTQLLKEFKYYKTDQNDNRVSLLADLGKPAFESKEWDSAVSPGYLCTIAERVGGFDSIHNCFNDYPRGSASWAYYHYRVELKIGNQTRYFEACPLANNIVTNYPMFDFNKIPASHKFP